MKSITIKSILISMCIGFTISIIAGNIFNQLGKMLNPPEQIPIFLTLLSGIIFTVALYPIIEIQLHNENI